VDGDPDLLGDSVDGLPAGLGIKRESLAFHEGDAAVTKFVEVAKSEACGAIVVEHDVCNAGSADVGGDADDRKGNALGQLRIDEQEAVDGAADEEVRIFLEKIWTAEMTDSEVEVAGLQKIFFDSQHEAGEVAFAELGNDDANGIGEPGAKHAGVHVGTILKLLGRIEDALAGHRGDGFSHRGVVEDDGDGRRGEVKILSEDLEGDGFARVGNLLFSGCHETPVVRFLEWNSFTLSRLVNGISRLRRDDRAAGNVTDDLWERFPR